MAIEQLRTMLLIALCVVLFLLWQAWQQDYGPKPPPRPAQLDTETATERAPAAPADVPTVPDTPSQAAPAPSPQAEGAAPAREVIEVRTDLLSVDISPVGGAMQRLELLAYPVSLDKPDEPVRLFDDAPGTFYIAQSGLRDSAGSDRVPDHHAVYSAERRRFELADDADVLEVPLRWRGADGLVVTKTYTFRRDSYVIDVEHVVENASAEPWTGRMYGQYQREPVAQEGGLFRIYTYTGGVVSSPDKPYEKIDFDDMRDDELKRVVEGGWAAMIQHYFASAWVPDQEAENYYYTKGVSDERVVLGVMTPERSIAAGETGVLRLTLFAGPKIQERLDRIAPHLERTVDYGWLWLIAEPLFWLLQWIHSFIGNWGWSIIVLTMLIKLAFFHLSATSYKSMARMRKLQPRIMALRDRYSGDKQRMNQKMMELYKEEKINPLGGCLPILVQIPVFIALYWVLLESVELRQAPFIFWLRDLSVHDPFFILPLLMGGTMFVQQKLNPPPPDPTQAKIMMALPFVFTFLFLFFPSGLVLYWFVNNLLSIAQQWVITKKIVGPTQEASS